MRHTGRGGIGGPRSGAGEYTAAAPPHSPRPQDGHVKQRLRIALTLMTPQTLKGYGAYLKLYILYHSVKLARGPARDALGPIIYEPDGGCGPSGGTLSKGKGVWPAVSPPTACQTPRALRIGARPAGPPRSAHHDVIAPLRIT